LFRHNDCNVKTSYTLSAGDVVHHRPLPDSVDGSHHLSVWLQVRKTPQGDVSVPITWAYNHHHDTAVVSANSPNIQSSARTGQCGGEDVDPDVRIANPSLDICVQVGKKSRLQKVHKSDPRMETVGKDYIRLSNNMAWIPVEDEPTESGVPSSAMFSDGNGGE
jgi:hypothetical protein